MHCFLAYTQSSILTWSGVARFTVISGIAAANAGILVEALENHATMVRGAKVAFVEAKGGGSRAARLSGSASGWHFAYRLAVSLYVSEISAAEVTG